MDIIIILMEVYCTIIAHCLMLLLLNFSISVHVSKTAHYTEHEPTYAHYGDYQDGYYGHYDESHYY